ncbi:MAG TPA: gamma-glutamyltransferase family protein, partial [Dehalococcoidia bacterium]|nr:gamma-glutamyltransferase family protein [Dehalococcoidia bacterium]
RSHRPLITGTTHMIGAGHYLATAAGYRILEQGGNAADAGVAAGLTLNVVLPQYTSLGGVAPIIVHDAARQETITVSGLGRWPKAASIDYFNQHHSGDLPAGVPRTVTPAAADAWLTTLKLYGTMTFEQVVTPALELAEGGFPIPHSLHRALSRAGDRLAHDEGETMRWARDARQFYPNGKALQPGDLLVQPDLARTLRRLIEAERGSAGQGREAAIQAARDRFYRGDIAQEMVRFNQGQGGLLTMEDLAEFHVGLEPPAVGSFRGVTVYTCDTWTQGPTSIQALQILEQFDLKAMGHNSADYLHTLLEALKLAFADRHAYYGDPKFVDVPLAGLLDQGYAAMRSQSIDPRRASPGMPEAGDPWPYQGQVRPPRRQARPEPVAGALPADTSYICVVDRWGNAFSATPSDGIGGSPVTPGMGFPISARGSQSWLDPEHPCAVAPGKRPRLTPNPAMAFRDGQVWMPFGTPGGDVQCQSMVQMLVNVVEFGMDVQQAVEAPRASTWSFPNSFHPHAYNPGLVGVEGRIPSDTIAELQRRGHQVEVWDDWTPRMGALAGIQIDRQRGGLSAGADLRRDGYAIGR